MLVTWTGWRDGRPWWTHTRDAGTTTEPVPTDLTLGIGPRGCIGFTRDGHRVRCTSGEAPRGRQCRVCQGRDTFRPCMICTGFDCPTLTRAMTARCTDEHHLYLASFGDGVVKVGTASKGRQEARLVEQGPLVACRIARGAGPRIKQMEHLLSTRSSLVEAVRRSRKLTLLAAGGGEQARPRVLEAVGIARDLLAEAYAAELHEPVWFEAPVLAVQSRGRAAGRTALPVEEGTRVDGKLVGAVGPIALIDDEGARFLLDLGDLVGRHVDPDPPHRLRRSTVQLGLFA